MEDFAFTNLKSLQILDLSNNKLENLKLNVLYNTFNMVTQKGHNLMARVLNLYGKIYC